MDDSMMLLLVLILAGAAVVGIWYAMNTWSTTTQAVNEQTQT